MAVTAALVKEITVRPLQGALRERIVDVTLDGAYAAGGEPLTATTLGLSEVYFATCYPKGGNLFSYDIAGALLKCWQDNNDAADGPMQDATAEPGALVVRMYVVGR